MTEEKIVKRSLTLIAFLETASRRGCVECRDGGQSVGRWQNTTGASPDRGEEGHGDDQIGRLRFVGGLRL